MADYCNDRFDMEDLPLETRLHWARQRTSYGTASMLADLLGCKCTPMEGGNVHGDNDVWQLGFRDERTGLGYQIHYWLTEHDDDADYCDIESVEITRDERWDRKDIATTDIGSEDAIDYEGAFSLLTNRIKQRHTEELRKNTDSSRERAWALEMTYAFAEGLAEAMGFELPELREMI